MHNELTPRHEVAQESMAKDDIKALVLASAANIQYFTGMTEPSIHACGVVVAFFQDSIKAEQNLGIRLEDTVLVTSSGAEMLPGYPREILPV